MSAIVQSFEHSLALPFFGIGMKTDLFQSCGHCEARRGSQGASRAAPGKSGLHARGEGVPKKGNAKECSNDHTIALISHTSKVMLDRKAHV